MSWVGHRWFAEPRAGSAEQGPDGAGPPDRRGGCRPRPPVCTHTSHSWIQLPNNLGPQCCPHPGRPEARLLCESGRDWRRDRGLRIGASSSEDLGLRPCVLPGEPRPTQSYGTSGLRVRGCGLLPADVHTHVTHARTPERGLQPGTQRRDQFQVPPTQKMTPKIYVCTPISKARAPWRALLWARPFSVALAPFLGLPVSGGLRGTGIPSEESGPVSEEPGERPGAAAVGDEHEGRSGCTWKRKWTQSPL